ncbi:MAG: hypothetical protein HS132_04355 [Planctomycetia bacterium]|nr:hypothetical protein [Planctomycetia bacterium]
MHGFQVKNVFISIKGQTYASIEQRTSPFDGRKSLKELTMAKQTAQHCPSVEGIL